LELRDKKKTEIRMDRTLIPFLTVIVVYSQEVSCEKRRQEFPGNYVGI
jgi:hypothetical protein